MPRAPGQDSGQLTWTDLVDDWVVRHGSLAAVAAHLAAERGFSEGVESIERGLRRLRSASGDGGVWGRRALRAFGLPLSVVERVRWMGQYHTRFTDLPTSLCLDLLRPWDRPPVSESPARTWIQLGLASVELRRRELERAEQRLESLVPTEPLARAEWSLVRGFVHSRTTPQQVARDLDQAEAAIADLEPSNDRACLHARWVDQLGYRLNVLDRDHEAALALYASIPDDGPPFARVRRQNGMGWSCHKLGRTEEAVDHARRSVEAAGDAGSLRLRAMALKLLAKAANDDSARIRAQAIAERLDDAELRFRVQDRA